MKKFLSVIALALVMATSAWADEAVFDFNANGLSMFDGITAVSTSSTHDGDITTTVSTQVSGVTLTVTPSGANTPNRLWMDYNLQAVQLRLYGGTLSVAAPEGKNVTAVTFNVETWNAPSASTGLVGDSRWSGAASNVTFTVSGQLRINSITVTYGEGGEVVIDPTATQVDSLQRIEELADGTKFQFTTEAYVIYQNGKYLYLQQHNNDDGNYFAALIYGNIDKTYEVGDVIPAGWKGTKTTYKTLVEVQDASDLGDANGKIDEYWTEPYDLTGSMSYIDETWVNYKVKLGGVTISDINDKNFTISDGENTLAGFNQFGLDLTEGGFDVEGMVSIYNGTVQLYPISITKSELPLWKIWYYGEDGQQCTVADDLYVDYIDEQNQLIYVTDNVTSVLWDEYAEWGYVWDEPWTPDWMAIDCGSDAQLFNDIKGMNVIKGGTLDITLQDNYTNPRLVVSAAPEAAESEKPEILYREVALTDTLNANGREILYVTGTYTDGHLEGTIEASGVNQSIELYMMPDMEGVQLEEGAEYKVKGIILQKEPWEESTSQGAPARVRNRQAAPARKSIRKMPIDDPAWYTNYELHAIAAEKTVATSVNDVNTVKAVAGVRYINAMGQVSDSAFDGMNIVVTRYTDGTTSTAKLVK